MVFEQNRKMEKLGEIFGFFSAYFLFTTVLFMILILLDKLPEMWSYFDIMGITFFITILGIIIARLMI